MKRSLSLPCPRPTPTQLFGVSLVYRVKTEKSREITQLVKMMNSGALIHVT